eukprot:gene16004-18978_t
MSKTSKPLSTARLSCWNVIDDVKDYETLWLWLEQGYLPALFPEPEWYNGDEYSMEEGGYFLEYNRLIGGFKMVQSRVQSCDCGDNSTLTSHEKTESREPFGPEWDPEKYEYNDEYGGFTVIIPPHRQLAELTLAELKNDKWIDKGTRKLSLTFNAYNGNTFRVEYYSTSGDQFRGFLEAVLLCYTLCSFLSELQELYQKRNMHSRPLMHAAAICILGLLDVMGRALMGEPRRVASRTVKA